VKQVITNVKNVIMRHVRICAWVGLAVKHAVSCDTDIPACMEQPQHAYPVYHTSAVELLAGCGVEHGVVTAAYMACTHQLVGVLGMFCCGRVHTVPALRHSF
jgi:hypothetical protein